MVDAGSDGVHMLPDTFEETLAFAKRFGIMTFFISGGEPLEHPRFFEYARKARDEFKGVVLVTSNGMFLSMPSVKEDVLKLGLNVQVTNDDRFYPHKVEEIEHPLISYEHRIGHVSPFGRALKSGLEFNRMSPLCFNLRSLTRSMKSFKIGVNMLEGQYLKFCTPSVDPDGTVRAGESTSCGKIGTVYSDEAELTETLSNMHCNQCGLFKNLSPQHLEALGVEK